MQISNVCTNCSGEVKSRRRDFTEQAWTVLVLWGEIQKRAVDQPICDHCYNELREVLIDRAEEIEAALKTPPVQQIQAKKVVETASKKAVSKPMKKATKLAS